MKIKVNAKCHFEIGDYIKFEKGKKRKCNENNGHYRRDKRSEKRKYIQIRIRWMVYFRPAITRSENNKRRKLYTVIKMCPIRAQKEVGQWRLILKNF